MKNKEKFNKIIHTYKETPIPENTKEVVENAILHAKKSKARVNRRRYIQNVGLAMAAALALVILPNTSATIAHAMEQLPLVGGFFKVVTIREYTYEDEKHQANVEIPQVAVMEAETETTEMKCIETGKGKSDMVETPAVQAVNKSIEEYTDQMLADFEASMEMEGYHELDITYETVTDTDTWFTLCINAVDIQASGYQTRRFYHIDKTTGTMARLEDLFKEGADYIECISKEILSQMQMQMEKEEGIYFIDTEDKTVEAFTKIKADENFYFNEAGELVIVFNEYEVAPGYMGCPEFVIPKEVTGNLFKYNQ
ncbi:MAG: DUF3298 domain-containing protein [Lachnospiraceae bacterium]|nr:DUF3298 domain-containing protein [Lachnospiraceae bacterium]